MSYCKLYHNGFTNIVHCSTNPFVASAADLIASLLEVTQWQGLDP